MEYSGIYVSMRATFFVVFLSYSLKTVPYPYFAATPYRLFAGTHCNANMLIWILKHPNTSQHYVRHIKAFLRCQVHSFFPLCFTSMGTVVCFMHYARGKRLKSWSKTTTLYQYIVRLGLLPITAWFGIFLRNILFSTYKY